MDQAQMSEVKGTCYCNLSWGSISHGGAISHESCGQQRGPVLLPLPRPSDVFTAPKSSSGQSWAQPVLPGCDGNSAGLLWHQHRLQNGNCVPATGATPWQLGLAKERVPSIELRAFITFLSLHPWANMWLRICLYFQIWHQVRKALIKFNRTNMMCHQWGTNPMPKNTIFTDLASFNILKTSSLHGLIYHWAHLTEGIGTAPKMPIFPSLTV